MSPRARAVALALRLDAQTSGARGAARSFWGLAVLFPVYGCAVENSYMYTSFYRYTLSNVEQGHQQLLRYWRRVSSNQGLMIRVFAVLMFFVVLFGTVM